MKTKTSLSILFALVFILSNVFNVSASSTAPVDAADKLLENYLAETDDVCVTSRINTSGDDAEERTDNGAIDLDGDTSTHSLQMYRAYGGSSTVRNWWGLRFLNVDIPQGATITSATVTFRANASSGSTASGMTLWGQLATNPSTFTTTANNISNRDLTSNSITWSVPQWTNGSDYLTPSLVDVVQEIVNQNGWAINNAMVIIGETTVSQNRSAISRDSTNGSTLAPLLSVCYSQGPAITTTGTLSAFSAPVGSPSASQTYTVSGSNLEDDIFIDPPDEFELSTDDITYHNSLELDGSSGTVNATSIYVRMKASGEAGTFSGDITHTSTGAAKVEVEVSGTVIVYYTLTVNSSTGGSVTLDPTASSYPSGTIVTLIAEPDSGYLFSSWSGHLSGDTNPITITMNEDKNITANFIVGICSDISLVTSADTFMNSGTTKGNYNYGGAATIQLNPYYKGGTDDQYRAPLLKWDLSSIPTGVTITHASLAFYVTTGETAYTYSLYSMMRDWVEGTGDGTAASTTSASWNKYDGTYSWGTAGAANTTSDRYDTNLWNAVASDFGATDDVIFPMNMHGVKAIQGWLDLPSTNNGLTIQNYSGTSTGSWIAASRENTSGYTKPTLNLTYCVPPSGPTITVDGTLNAFYAEPGEYSDAQTYTVAGLNLEDDITITAPAGFEISEDGSLYDSSLILERVVGEVEETTIYVRLYSESEGTFSGNITHVSTGASQVDVSVSGTVILGWIAYNDMNPYSGDANDTNVSEHTYETTDGVLVNYLTGESLDVTISGSCFDGDDEPVTCDDGFEDYGGQANAGTDAAEAFGATGSEIVDFQNMVQVSEEDYDVITFNNLDPEKTYVVTLSTNRDDVDYANIRYTKVTIQGAETYTNASSEDVVVNSEDSVSFSTGYNTVNGYVAKWIGITGGVDGSISIKSEWDSSQGSGTSNSKGYAMTAVKLEEKNFAPNQPVPVQPTDDALGISTSPTLEITATDPESDMMDVTFYGREAGGAVFTAIGTVDNVASGSNASITWPDLENNTEYEWYVDVTDGVITTTATTWSFMTGFDLTVNADPQDGGTTDPAVGVHTFTEDTVVPVTATPADGYEFDHWSGACTGTGTCSIIMDANKSVTAHFSLKTYTISGNAEVEGVAITYDGESVITDEQGDYSFTVTHGWSGTATPSLTGYTFDPANREYSNITADQIEQDFNATLVKFTLSVDLEGIGSGEVTSVPDGITCGADCTEDYDYNTEVTLTALASAGSSFVGWGGGACTGTEPCVVTMDDDKSVTAAFEPLPEIESLDLVSSGDKSTWEDVYGALGSGFVMALDGREDFSYLDVRDVVVNHALKSGYHAFFLDTDDLPDGFYEYWAVKGVTAGADPMDWEYQMWQIINGTEPMFYLKVGTSPEYQLIDGLVKLLGQDDEYLRVSGDYPVGTYHFEGVIEDNLGVQNSMQVAIEFEAYPQISSLELVESLDKTDWALVSGDLAAGFEMELDPREEYYYLDVRNVEVNKLLTAGYYPFMLDTDGLPAEFYTYWAAKGVTAGADPTGWQGRMWQIISGAEPMFYLKVGEEPSYQLVDGFSKLFFGNDEFLRVNGDYPAGIYQFEGEIEDEIGASSDMSVEITFTQRKFTLDVDVEGSGNGEVSSVPDGITCGADCTEDYNYNTEVTLTALASAGSSFVGWGGACTGTGPCVVTMDDDKSVTAAFEPLPEIESLDLVSSGDKSTWEDVYGALGSGFVMALDGSEDFSYLDVRDVVVNHALKSGYHAFFLDTDDLPDGFYEYWAVKGVTAGADPMDWEYRMWQIINGTEPMFYLKVGTSPEYQLIDGLVKLLGQDDEYLRVSGDYPVGTYHFEGVIEDDLGVKNSMEVAIEFEAYPQISSLELIESLDKTVWSSVGGDLTTGFAMELDSNEEFYYLDVQNVVVNNVLAEEYHPFMLNTGGLPSGYYEYWAEKGVDEYAASGSWELQMYQIISGAQPMFYLKVGEEPSYQLIDGFSKLFFGNAEFLRVNGDYPAGTYQFEGEIEDEIGASSDMTVQITFTTKNEAPELAAIENKLTDELVLLTFTALADDDGLPSDTLIFSLSKGTSGEVPAGAIIGSDTGIFTWTPSEAQGPGTYTFDVCVSDGELTNCETIVVTVNEVNVAPVVSGIADQTIDEGDSFATILLDDFVSDADHDDIDMSWLYSGTIKLGVSIVDRVATIIIPDANWNGSETITFRATDPGNLWDEDSAIFTVNGVNNAPVITNPGNQIGAEGDVVSLFVTVDDPDIGDTLTFSAIGLPDYLSIDANTGEITGTLGYDSAGIHNVTIKATDSGDLYDEESFTWTVSNVNRAPVLLIPGDLISSEGYLVSVSLGVNDPDTGDTFKFGDKGLPVDLVLDEDTGNIAGTLGFTSAGIYTVTVRVTDNGGLFDEETFTWTVNNVIQAPEVSDIPDQTINEGETFAFINLDDYVSDLDNADAEIIWTYSGNNELNVSIENRVATISLPDDDWDKSETITFRATDPDSLRDEDAATFTVLAEPDAPVITNPGDQNTAEGEVVSLFIIANDPDSGNTLTFSATGLPSELSMDANTGEITGTLGFSSAGIYNVTVKVTDAGGLFDEESFTWTVNETNQAPVITEGESVQVIMSQNGDPIPFNLTLNATDADSGTLVWSIHTDANFGSATASGSGQSMVIGYTPDVDYTGADSFVVQVADDDGGFDTIVVNVTINPAEVIIYQAFLPVLMH